MLDVELRQLIILREIAKHMSFSMASDTLYLSQSTISAHIKNLEKTIGLKLLDRNKARIAPTQEGEIVLRYAEHIISLLEEMEDYLSQYRVGLRGLLTLELAPTVYGFVMPDIIYNFTKQFPNIQVRAITNISPIITQNVISGKTQIGFIKMPTAYCNIHGLNSLLIEKDRSVAVAHENHHLLKKKQITMADIAQEQLLFYGYNTSYATQVQAVYEEMGLDFSISMTFDNLDALRTILELGSGISFLPSKVYKDSLSKARIVAVPVIDMPPIERYTFVIYKAVNLCEKTPLSNFIQYIKDYGKVLEQ